MTKWLKTTAIGLVACFAAAELQAQAGPGAPVNRAIQLPLSGQGGEPGAVATVQNPLPGGAQSVNTLSSSVEVQGAYQGSVPMAQAPGASLQLSLAEALKKGLESNLGTVEYQNATRQARAQRRQAFSALLPDVSGYALLTDEDVNLASLGFTSIKFPAGIRLPSMVGPFHYYDARAQLTANIVNLTALRNYRASDQLLKATQFSARDARDLVVLAVTGSYLAVIAASSRIDSAKAQVAAAEALYKQAMDRHDAGLAARIDVTRSEVELRTQQQRLISEQTDYAKQKIQLGRLIGLPPGQEFTLIDTLPYAPLTNLTLEQALSRAYANRSDLKAAQAQVNAAELAKKAAVAERYPSADVAANYGAVGPSPSLGTFTVTGTLRFSIFDAGRIRGDIEEADAAFEQRHSEFEDLRGQIDAEVRQAFLDLNAAASQVSVAQSNRDLAQETLAQSRDRFAAGVADTVEVVQAQEQVAAAEQDYITSLYAHNLAKASVARAMGQADQTIQQFLGKP